MSTRHQRYPSVAKAQSDTPRRCRFPSVASPSHFELASRYRKLYWWPISIICEFKLESSIFFTAFICLALSAFPRRYHSPLPVSGLWNKLPRNVTSSPLLLVFRSRVVRRLIFSAVVLCMPIILYWTRRLCLRLLCVMYQTPSKTQTDRRTDEDSLRPSVCPFVS